MRDPLVQLRRWMACGRIAALVGLVPLCWWAMLPVDVATEQPNIEPLNPIGVLGQAGPEYRPQLDTDSFSARLWNPLPSPTAATEDTSRSPQLPQLTLIGIIDTDGQPLQAALYDARSDRLLIVAAGDTVREFAVEQITAASVVIRAGEARFELRIKEERS